MDSRLALSTVGKQVCAIDSRVLKANKTVTMMTNVDDCKPNGRYDVDFLDG